MLDEIKKEIDVLDCLSDFSFVIQVKDGEVSNDLFTLSYKDYFYFLDNGEPTYSLYPQNITRRFNYYFENILQKQIYNEIINGVLNKHWAKDNVRACLQKYTMTIEEWFRNNVQSTETGFSNKITCILKEK